MLTVALLTMAFAQAEPDARLSKFHHTPDATYQPADPKLGGCRSLTISPDGKLLAGAVNSSIASEQYVIVWDTTTKKEIARIAQQRSITAVVFSPNGGLLASADNNGVIKLTDTSTWKVKDTIKYDGGFYRLAFSPDGAVLLSGGTADSRDLVLWDVAKGIRQTRIHVTDDNTAIHAVAFAPSGKQFAAAWDKKIKLYDHATCKELREFAGHAKCIASLAFSPDGSKLASVSPSARDDPNPLWDTTTVKLWDVGTGKEIPLPTRVRKWGDHQCVRWSPDGKRLAVSTQAYVQVIDFEKPRQIIEIDASHKSGGGSDSICFSPDGKYLYAAGNTRIVTRWNLDAPAEPFPLPPKP
jgi:WD40 repeat protein